MKSQRQFDKTFSVELFPPRTAEGFDKLTGSIEALSALHPRYFSVTYGAGGSTQQRTFEAVDWLRQQGIETAPHISCIGSTRAEIDAILQRYMQQGITRLVALRGDLPSGSGFGAHDELRYANELVEHIRRTTGDHFHIEVAAYPEYHPQAASPMVDLENFKRKVEAGANAAITQYFYNADAYFAFLDDCARAGIEVPITPGIMPITNYRQLARFSQMCGAEIPQWIARRLEGYGDDLEAINAFGLDVVTRLCERLLEGGAPGLHIYTLNRARAGHALWQRLNPSL